jgi:hypothetical protein
MIRTEAVTEISLRFYLIFDSYHGKNRRIDCQRSLRRLSHQCDGGVIETTQQTNTGATQRGPTTNH